MCSGPVPGIQTAGQQGHLQFAPAFLPERVTVFTHNVSQADMLGMLEEVADRLRVIEQEVLRPPRSTPAAK